MDVDDVVSRLYDIYRIERLAVAYAIAMDGRDLQAVVDLFVADVRVRGSDGGVVATGRAALAQRLGIDMATSRLSVMSVSNHLITLDSEEGGDPDRARGVVYCRCLAEFGGSMVEQMIRYDDRYGRLEDDWRFISRRHRLWWGVEMAERPLDQPPANWPERPVGVGTLPAELSTWSAFWASRPEGRPPR